MTGRGGFAASEQELELDRFRFRLAFSAGAVLLAFATLPAAAQTAPPIKPGLWTVEKYESSGDGAPNAGQRQQMADEQAATLAD